MTKKELKDQIETKEFKGEVETKKRTGKAIDAGVVILKNFHDSERGETFTADLEVDLDRLVELIEKLDLEEKGFVEVKK